MEIKKHGRNIVVDFKCPHCGCKFTAGKGEYQFDGALGGYEYICDCPECGFGVECGKAHEEPKTPEMN